MGKRTGYFPEFKAKVALEAIRGELTLAELSARHGVHPNMISRWKRLAIEQMSSLFGGGGAEAVKEKEAEVAQLHAKIGQLGTGINLVGCSCS